ncbi:hypothetical protein C437_04915 [Haloarcula vallismortis ATCC 29715]|uniref:Uncharacterized protein n=1 Tax=Haloarcula vallismortis ATCC 29715 TaxID=662477 RepID=M0JQP7_HALVA|nr:hypothetical protein C437_04915 [Haloarcula vallismortis ATCC 29715]
MPHISTRVLYFTSVLPQGIDLILREPFTILEIIKILRQITFKILEFFWSYFSTSQSLKLCTCKPVFVYSIQRIEGIGLLRNKFTSPALFNSPCLKRVSDFF